MATEQEIISSAMRIMGSRKSIKKAASSRRNGRKFKGKKRKAGKV